MDSAPVTSPTGPFASRVILAPLTVGGNLPFRRLCVELGAEITFGEMAVVKRLLDRRRSEFALLRSHPDEPMFGVQLADRDPLTLAEGARLAESRGARFVDLNCGCPIDDITRRGLGSALLRKPAKVGRLVEAMVRSVSVPVTVKIRAGWSLRETNAPEVARVCEEAGATAVTVHGRTREQRYGQRADWDIVGEIASERRIEVIGNGDILTHFEARDRRVQAGVTSLMIGRGALIKPWVFREVRQEAEWLPTAEERFEVIFRYLQLLREHFGEGELGRERIVRFLSWHLGFLTRYRPFPEALFLEASRDHPLLQTRQPDDEALPPLEQMLRHPSIELHAQMAKVLEASASLDEGRVAVLELHSCLPEPRGDDARSFAISEVAG